MPPRAKRKNISRQYVRDDSDETEGTGASFVPCFLLFDRVCMHACGDCGARQLGGVAPCAAGRGAEGEGEETEGREKGRSS